MAFRVYSLYDISFTNNNLTEGTSSKLEPLTLRKPWGPRKWWRWSSC